MVVIPFILIASPQKAILNKRSGYGFESLPYDQLFNLKIMAKASGNTRTKYPSTNGGVM